MIYKLGNGEKKHYRSLMATTPRQLQDWQDRKQE